MDFVALMTLFFMQAVSFSCQSFSKESSTTNKSILCLLSLVLYTICILYTYIYMCEWSYYVVSFSIFIGLIEWLGHVPKCSLTPKFRLVNRPVKQMIGPSCSKVYNSQVNSDC